MTSCEIRKTNLCCRLQGTAGGLRKIENRKRWVLSLLKPRFNVSAVESPYSPSLSPLCCYFGWVFGVPSLNISFVIHLYQKNKYLYFFISQTNTYFLQTSLLMSCFNNVQKRLGYKTRIIDKEKTDVYKIYCDDSDKLYIGQT